MTSLPLSVHKIMQEEMVKDKIKLNTSKLL